MKIAEIAALVVFWSMVFLGIAEVIYDASWAKRRGIFLSLLTSILLFWAIAHFGISFPF